MLTLVMKPPNLDYADHVFEKVLAEMQDTESCTEHITPVKASLEEHGPKVRLGDVEASYAYYYVLALGVTRALEMHDPSVVVFLTQTVTRDLAHLSQLLERRGHLIKLSERLTLDEFIRRCTEKLEEL